MLKHKNVNESKSYNFDQHPYCSFSSSLASSYRIQLIDSV